MTLARIHTPEATLAFFQRQLERHADNPTTGACPSCRRTECGPWREARAQLAMAWILDWDPIREAARERMWLNSLADR